MPEIQNVRLIDSKPGIRRDGTNLDGDFYSDGQWVRFQRGRPKKMGGYSRISDSLSGPVRELLVWSRGDQINVFSFSPSTIEVVQIDQNGGGSAVTDLTPVANFTANDGYLWSVDTMYDDAVGSKETIVLAVPIKVADNIDDTTDGYLFIGPADGSAAFAKVADSAAVASGGVMAIGPYAVLYGSDGAVTWSNVNEPQNYTTGDAGSDRVTGSKIVNGKSIRSGSGPAGILWSLDSVLRMDYVGGQAIFRFSKLGVSSILARNSVIEYDGSFYWLGIDRMYMTNGSAIAEIPNQMNLNWLYENLNYTHRNKIWAMKIPRFGEIWWFYPRGENTECSHAIIFNVREQAWYDCELPRSAGFSSQVFRYPIMVSSVGNDKFSIEYTVTSGSFSVGDNILGSSSGATGSIVLDTGTVYHVIKNSSVDFIEGEGVTNVTGTGGFTADVITEFYSIYNHEKGKNKVEDEETAIDSYFVTADFGLPANAGINRLTNLIRIEPDFIQTGGLTVEVLGFEYANSEVVTDGPYEFDSETAKIDLRSQRRHLQLKIRSNEVDGHYEMGKTIVWTEPGDLRP